MCGYRADRRDRAAGGAGEGDGLSACHNVMEECAVPLARKLPVAGLLAAGILVYASLAISGMLTTSAYYDETAHLPAGYTYLKLRDFRMNPEHPPLVKELAALPLLLMDVQVKTDRPEWARGQQWEFGHQ